jgi:hypothetical protein
MTRNIFSLLHFLFLIFLCVTALPNNVIAEKLLVKDGKMYICVAVIQGYCTNCSGKNILVGGGSVTTTNKRCVPPIGQSDKNKTSTDKKKDQTKQTLPFGEVGSHKPD